MTIIEENIHLYTAGLENAQRRLLTCVVDHEQYWQDISMKYGIVLNALKILNKSILKYENR